MSDNKNEYSADAEGQQAQTSGDEKMREGQDARGNTAGVGRENVSAPPDEIKAEFHPFYEKEAKADIRIKAASTILLSILLVGLGLALLGLALDVLLNSPAYKLETTATVLVCFVLIGILWKNITLEAKAGLAALSLGLILAWPQFKFVQEGMEFPRILSAGLIWPIFFALSLIAVLLAVWLLWFRKGWLPVLLSLPVLYGALSPVFSLINDQTSLKEIILGPAFMANWPIFIRSGYLTAEVILPLGILLMIILQVRTLFRKHYKTHFGYIFWALFLILSSFIGLSALEAENKPVALSVNQLARLSAQAPEATPVLKPAPSENQGKTSASPTLSKGEQPTEQASPASQPEIKPAPGPSVSTTAPEEKIPESSKIADLEAKIQALQKKLDDTNQRLQKQEAMIKALQLDVNSKLKKEKSLPKKQEKPGTPAKSVNPAVPLNRI